MTATAIDARFSVRTFRPLAPASEGLYPATSPAAVDPGLAEAVRAAARTRTAPPPGPNPGAPAARTPYHLD